MGAEDTSFEGSGAEVSRFEGSGAEGSGFEGSGADGSGFEGSGAEDASFEGSGAEGSGIKDQFHMEGSRELLQHPKQQRQPLPFLLSLSFFYVLYCSPEPLLEIVTSISVRRSLATCMDPVQNMTEPPHAVLDGTVSHKTRNFCFVRKKHELAQQVSRKFKFLIEIRKI